MIWNYTQHMWNITVCVYVLIYIILHCWTCSFYSSLYSLHTYTMTNFRNICIFFTCFILWVNAFTNNTFVCIVWASVMCPAGPNKNKICWCVPYSCTQSNYIQTMDQHRSRMKNEKKKKYQKTSMDVSVFWKTSVWFLSNRDFLS